MIKYLKNNLLNYEDEGWLIKEIRFYIFLGI